MSNELVKANALPVREMSDLAIVGQAIAASGMFGVKNKEGGMVIAVTCHQQGITLLDYNRTYHTIDGKPSMKADAMLAGFRKAGGKYEIIENSLTRAAAKFTFEGKSYDFEYTIEDAMRTHDCLNGKGEVKDIWKKRPDDMLWARMVSRAVRRLTPEVNAGLYTPEEVQDFDSPPITTHVEVIAPAEAASRAQSLAKPAKVISKADNPDLCPIGEGEFLYKPWSEFDSVSLEQAFRSGHEAITDDHKHQIAVILADRGVPVPGDDIDEPFNA
jgi:hypothetical protein